MMTLGTENSSHAQAHVLLGWQVDTLQQRRDALQSEIDAIYEQYDVHIASRLQRGDGGYVNLDDLPSDEEYADYALSNTPLKSLEAQLFHVTLALQDLRLTSAAQQ